jgi:hypothetical protein
MPRNGFKTILFPRFGMDIVQLHLPQLINNFSNPYL